MNPALDNLAIEAVTPCWQAKLRLGFQDDLGTCRLLDRWHTINPAITHGISHVVGSLEAGKIADIVLWQPAFFGVKPSMILKGGMIAAALMGDPNASISTPQPVHARLMFGVFAGGPSRLGQDCVVRKAVQAHARSLPNSGDH